MSSNIHGGGAVPETHTSPHNITSPATTQTRERRSSSTLSEGTSTPLLMAALPPMWEHQVRSWLQEDVPGFDIGGFVVGGR